MVDLALLQFEMKPAALVMLVLFAAACAIFLPREFSFIRGAGRAWQGLFYAQDALIIVSVLAVLLPCVIARQLTAPLLVTVLSGFTLLWVSAIWAATSRYSYVRQLLQSAREEEEAKLRALLQAPPVQEAPDEQ
jgi:hypothetical protein